MDAARDLLTGARAIGDGRQAQGQAATHEPAGMPWFGTAEDAPVKGGSSL